MGNRIKIGVLVFTNKQKERGNDIFFDKKKYYGFRYILNEIDKTKYELEYTSSKNIFKYKYVLVSITSYYDILNLQNENINKGEAKIIAGGAGISNPKIIAHIADIIVVGRGEGLINRILNGETPEGVYFDGESWDVIQPKRLIKLNDWQEKDVGCSKKCFFCQYSWKHKSIVNEKYSSGFNNKEDFFTYHDWGNKNAVSAIDGLTEKTRKIINKNITNIDIISKIREIQNHKEDQFKIKLYMILGFPWETENDFDELKEVLKEADFKSNKKLNIWFNSTHFVPMPFTPMQNEAVNLFNFRNLVIKNYWVKSFYDGKTIKASFMPHFSTPESAVIQTIINRGNPEHLIKINRIVKNNKYKKLKFNNKIRVLQNEFDYELYGKSDINNNGKIPYNLSGAISLYNKRVENYN